MGGVLALSEVPFLTTPEDLAQSFSTGEIAQGKGAAALEILEESAGRVRGDDSLFSLIAAYRRAVASGDSKTMQRLGPAIAAELQTQGASLRRILNRIHRRELKVDLKDPGNQFRLAIRGKFAALYLRGRNAPLSAGLVPEEHLHVYFIDPLSHLHPQAWFSMLQATFYAALDRSYTNQEGIEEGRDCLDREIHWRNSLGVYIFTKDEKLAPEAHLVRFHPHWPRNPESELVPDRGILRATFQEVILENVFSQRVLELQPTASEIRQAKRQARQHLIQTPSLTRLRLRWLRAKASQAEEAKQAYLETLAKSFGFDRVRRTPKTSNVNGNPDLFLIYQFLKGILWQRFSQSLKNLVKGDF